MEIRERIEAGELRNLANQAAKSMDARRERPERPCPFRTAFQQDRDRILHSKAFRRLKHKTQVYISPGDHYRTRMTHSLEVAQISRTIARALELNEDLTEAIALGHDVGHTPFGHAGEAALRDIVGCYNHNEQSLRVVDFLEKDGQGLNLTAEVRDGILRHTGSEQPGTLEGKIVRIGDRIAYLCHDYDDGIRAGLVAPEETPQTVSTLLGASPSEMITAMAGDIIVNSASLQDIVMSDAVRTAMDQFRAYMFDRVYFSPPLAPEREKAFFVIRKLYDYFTSYPNRLPAEYQERETRWGRETTVVDYIAGLTDLYAIKIFQEISIPRAWNFDIAR